MTRTGRVVLVAAAIGAAVLAFVLLRPDDEDGGGGTSTTTARTPATTGRSAPTPPRRPSVPVVRLREGGARGGPLLRRARGGERIRFAVTSNVEDEVHVHGYDLTRRVPAGGRALFSFRARLEGVFEVESHASHEAVASLRVTP